MSRTSTGAVLVTYNSAVDIDGCLDSLLDQGVERVVVVDNASSDDTVERVRRRGGPVEVIQNHRNVGFAAAINQGATALPGVDRLALVNPDTVAEPGALAALDRVLDERPDVAVVGPRIVNSDGTAYPSVRRFPDLVTALGHAVVSFVAPRNRWSRRYKLADADLSSLALVDWAAFTFVLVRRDAWDQMGGLDERYFMYVEDVDFCWRCHRAGWAVAFEPAARVMHRIGGSSESVPYRMIAHHHRSLWKFALRTVSGWHRLLLPVLAVGLAGRVLAAWVQHLVRRRPHAAQ